MATTSSVYINVALAGDVLGAITVPAQVNATSPAERQSIALSAGDNTVTPPTGCLTAIIVPPTNSGVAKTLKNTGSDQGLPISPSAPTVLALPTGAGAFIINAGGPETILVNWL